MTRTGLLAPALIPSLAAVLATVLAASLSAVLPAPAAADMVISQVIVDFVSPAKRRADIEILNRGRERMYIVVQPSQIVNPGQGSQSRVRIVDPGKHGLLVSPLRMILEPGQRRIVRFAALTAPKGKDRIYRVTIKPVVGKLKSKRTAVKIVVGYDLLVIQRPAKAKAKLSGSRSGKYLVVTNNGNTNALLLEGKQCPRGSKRCAQLPARRVYPGATVRIKLRGRGPVQYLMQVGTQTERLTF
jgi:P pilus assembly chaperone PapD